jgi:uncharacterized membrane-anchored protein YitT (DUF2179 family)
MMVAEVSRKTLFERIIPVIGLGILCLALVLTTLPTYAAEDGVVNWINSHQSFKGAFVIFVLVPLALLLWKYLKATSKVTYARTSRALAGSETAQKVKREAATILTEIKDQVSSTAGNRFSKIIDCPNPNCLQKLRVPTDKMHSKLRCPRCNNFFYLRE